MPLWHCTDCTTAYSVGAPACPQCGSTRHLPDALGPCQCGGCGTSYGVKITTCPRCKSRDIRETSMAKITVGGGASNTDADDPSDTAATVGEHGPERVELPSGASVVPGRPAEPETDEASEDEAGTAEEPAGSDDVEPSEEDDVDNPAGDGETDAAPAYSTWTATELRAELGKRRLPTSGLKPELVERLEQHGKTGE